MPVDVTCSSCQRKMRVPDTAAGKRIKCPKCQGVIDVPGAGTSGVQMGVAVEMWHLKTDDGQIYGPISRADLDQWQVEGRLNMDSQVLRAGSDQWQWASDLYPQLAGATTVVGPVGAPSGPVPAVATANPFDFTGGSQHGSAPAAPANPFDFSASGSSGGGPSVSSASTTKLSDKSKVVAGLLGIFLGAWGVHNFYLGNTNKGILQIVVTLITCSLGGLWGPIEGIMILTGSINRDARGRKLRD